MTVDRKWVERNLGFDPIAKPAPASTFAFKRAAKAAKIEDLQREIIDFDFEVAGRPAVHVFQHGHWAVAIYRHSLAERTCP